MNVKRGDIVVYTRGSQTKETKIVTAGKKWITVECSCGRFHADTGALENFGSTHIEPLADYHSRQRCQKIVGALSRMGARFNSTIERDETKLVDILAVLSPILDPDRVHRDKAGL